LVILEPTGELITDEGRAAVMGDPVGAELPWRPKSILDLLNAGEYVDKEGNKKTFQEVSKNRDAIGLYFSASWCGPCHRFTPILSECYKALKESDGAAKRNQRFEVIFLSSDRDANSFEKYYHEMPWTALSFDRQDLKTQLETRYKVEGIPTLVIVDPRTGASINEDSVQVVVGDPKGEDFPWAPKSVELLDPTTAGKIGPTPAVFVFCDSDEQAKALQRDLITAVDVWRGKAEEGAVCHGDVCVPTGGKLEGVEDVLFYVCGKNPMVDRVKEIAKIDKATVAVLDLSGPTYAHCDTIASPDKVAPMGVRKFVQAYLAGSVQKHSVQKTE